MDSDDAKVSLLMKSARNPDAVSIAVEKFEIQELHSSSFSFEESPFGYPLESGRKNRPRIPLIRAVYHIFKANVGAGVFLLPTFYQTSGYLLGALMVFFLGVIVVDCAVALIKVKQKLSDPLLTTYSAVVRFVLGSKVETFANVALIFTQFGFCTIYLQYAASVMSTMWMVESGSYWFLILSTAIVTPLTCLSHRMEKLAFASLVASVSVLAALCSTLIVALQSLISNGISPGVYKVVFTPRILLFVSGYLFSLEGVGIVLPIEDCLDHRGQQLFPSFLRKILFFIIAMYFCFGVLGYLAYGDSLTTSVVLSLPEGKAKQITEFLVALSLILSYPVQYVPAIQLLDTACNIEMKSSPRSAVFLRLCINTILAIIAGIVGPQALNMMASFIGAFGGVHLMITIPALLSLFVDVAIDSKSSEKTVKKYFWSLVKSRKEKETGKWLLYVLFTTVVWLGGLVYTGLVVYSNSVSEGVGPVTTSVPSAMDNYSV